MTTKPGPAGKSAHVDTFCSDRLPPRDQWPVMLWDLDILRYPEQLNCGVALLDEAVARGWGPRTCLTAADGSISLSYSDLLEWSNRLANVLTEDLGVVPGNRVLLHCFNTPWAVAAWFAVVRIGGVVVTTMPLLRSGEIATILAKAEVKVGLVDHRLESEVRAAGCPVVVPFGGGHGDLLSMAKQRPPDFHPIATAADDVALLAFTSGTTGVPKCTMHFHRDVLAVADTFQPILGADEGDVFCGSPPLGFTFGLGGLVVFPMRVGASSVLTETPSDLLPAIERHRCTVCFTAPTAYRNMLSMLDDFDVSSLRIGVSAGETLPKTTWEAFLAATGVALIDGIGATEMLHIFISASGDAIRPGATGKPLPGVAALVVDESMEPLPDGQVGLLAVRGPTGCRYLDDDRQAEYVRLGWNVTGDAYRRDSDGYFWFEARADDMIISAGYNIAGPEVEASLLKHPAVAECAVVGVSDDRRGQVVKAFVILRDSYEGHDSLRAELMDFVKSDIAPYKAPRKLDFIRSLPKTQTGKVKRYVLRSDGPVAD